MLFSVGAVVALAMASGLLAEARTEFQGRLRDRQLRRVRGLMGLAVAASATVTGMVGYAGWPAGAEPIGTAHAGELLIGRDLRLSQSLGGASGLGPHLRKQQDVADRR